MDWIEQAIEFNQLTTIDKASLRITETISNVEGSLLILAAVAHEFGLKWSLIAHKRGVTLGISGDDSAGID